MIRPKPFVWILALGIIGFCLVLGCGKSRTNANPYVGNMDDYTYSGQRSDEGCVYRVNGHGEEVCVADFEGRFVWADYAAPWCRPCVAQAKIIKALEKEGASVKAYDPVATERAKMIMPNIEYCSNPYDVAKGVDAIVLVTEWDEFKELDMQKIKAAMRQPVLVDGRNVLEPEKMRQLGFIYTGIGR